MPASCFSRQESLITALREGWLSGAWLDVFAVEPLPADSQLWTTPGVHITPHVAAVTFPETVVEVFMENMRRCCGSARGCVPVGVIGAREKRRCARLSACARRRALML